MLSHSIPHSSLFVAFMVIIPTKSINHLVLKTNRRILLMIMMFIFDAIHAFSFQEPRVPRCFIPPFNQLTCNNCSNYKVTSMNSDEVQNSEAPRFFHLKTRYFILPLPFIPLRRAIFPFSELLDHLSHLWAKMRKKPTTPPSQNLHLM